MAESYITRKGSSGPQTELPVITFISLNDTSLTFTIRNEDDNQAFVYYELDDDTPDANNITLNGNTTSSNIVLSGLTPGTEYTLYVWADAFNKSTSQVVSNTQTTTNTTANPTINYVSKTFNSITFTVTNNDSATATVYYEENDNTPDANSVVLNAGATSSNLTISGLTKQTSYTVYAQAQATGKLLSSAVSFTETTPDFPTLANPTITFVSASSDRIRITLKNNATVSANIYYEHSDTTPDANFITLGAGVTSGTIEITGLNPSTSYTIYAQAEQTNNNPSGIVNIASSTTAVQGQQVFNTSGTFTVPAGVTSVSVVCVGGGGGGDRYIYYIGNGDTYNPWDFGQSRSSGGGAGLGWRNNIPVTPGEQISIIVGAGGTAYTQGGQSVFNRGSFTTSGGGGGNAGSYGSFSGTGGGNGGIGNSAGYGSSSPSVPNVNGGGGAGGYSGTGGGGGGSATSGGGGGRGGTSINGGYAGAGGGVGLLGQGTQGTPGANGQDGIAGSGGSGITYGGGAHSPSSQGATSTGGNGAVRIIWGTNRSFPSTNTGDV
jgi:hypothetical protein